MAHWVALPDGGFVNTDNLTQINPESKSEVARGSRRFVRNDGYSDGLAGENAEVLAAAIREQIAARGVVYELEPRKALSIDAARLMASGEERALGAVRPLLASLGYEADHVHEMIATIRGRLGTVAITAEEIEPEPDTLPPPVDPIGPVEDVPGSLDLRVGDAVMWLRYGGIDYCAAIKIRFGDAPEGMTDRYLEISFHHPVSYAWLLLTRETAKLSTPKSNFMWAVAKIFGHDRDALRGAE